MARRSELLKQMFSTTKAIKLVDLSVSTLLAIVEQCYMPTPPLDLYSAITFFRNAVRLDIKQLKENCLVFFRKVLDNDTCFKLFQLAHTTGNLELKTIANKFILLNFTELYRNNADFLDLSFSDLQSLLEDDQLNVQGEDEVFSAIEKWILVPDSETRGTRENHFPSLFQAVRLPICSIGYMESLSRNHLVNLYPPTLKYITKTLRLVQSTNPRSRSTFRKQRRFRHPPEVVLAIGGWSRGNATSAVEILDHKTQKWTLMNDFSNEEPRAYHGLVVLKGLVYMIGGFSGSQCFSTCRAFDPIKKTWSLRANMSMPRCYVSCAVLDDHIYAMGGFDGQNRTSTVERYDPARNQWSRVASMGTVRSDASAAILKGKLYCVGGFTGVDILASGEVYDPGTNVWTAISRMETIRSGLSLCSCNDYVWAFGGFDGVNRLKTCERYHPETNHWTRMPEMNLTRSNFAVCLLVEYFYVIGGFGGVQTVNEVERFNMSTQTWEMVRSMNVTRSALKAVVLLIHQLPNYEDFVPRDSEHL